MTRPAFKLLAAATTAFLAGLAGTAQAGTQTNTMNNIVTLTDACDIAAIGVDFGVTSYPLPSAGVTALPAGTANNGTANAMSGNSTHPYFGKDGGAANNDDLSLTTPISAVNGVLSTVLTTVTGTLGTPGVYVVCTVTPSSIKLTSANGGTPANLPTAAGNVTPVAFTGRMVGVGGGAGGSNFVSYGMTLAPVVASTAVSGSPVSVFSGIYSMTTGTIPAAQAGNNTVVGQYWDGATAQVDY